MTIASRSAPGIPPTHRQDVRWRHVLVVVLALIAMLAANARFAERIRVGDGLGWDGVRYARIVADPRAAVLEGGTDRYTFQRVLPNLLVRGVLAIADARPTNPNIVRAYMAYNAVLLVLTAVMWGLIARSRGLSVRAFGIGAVALFVSTANVKIASFYPVLTDTSAFALGMLVLLCHTRRSTLGLAICALVGTFSWPIALPLILPLLLWPRGTAVPTHSRSTPIATVVAGGTAAVLIACFAYVYVVLDRRVVGYGPVAPVVPALLPLSLIAFAAVCFFGLRALLRGMDLRYVGNLLRAVTPMRAALAIGLVIVGRIGIAALASPTLPPALPTMTFFATLAFSPMTRPLVSIISHVTYFGPWVVLTVMLWGHVAATARREGAGLVAFVAGAFILAFLPESRQAMFVVPVFVALTVIAAEAVHVPDSVYILIAVAAVAMSRFWQRFGTGHTFSDLRAYFNNQGFYMDARAYVVTGLIAVALGVAMAAMLRGRVRVDAARSPGDGAT